MVVLHDGGELGLLLQDGDFGALPVDVGDAGQALELDDVLALAEVVAVDGEGEAEALDGPGLAAGLAYRCQFVQVVGACLMRDEIRDCSKMNVEHKINL